MSVSGNTQIFVIFAHPPGQVRAPTLFNQRFKELGIDHIMIPIDVAPLNLVDVVNSMRGISNIRGGVVTIPHKIEIAKLCDELGPGARATGAVNAFRYDADGRLHGDNFDGVGFVAGLKDNGHSLEQKKLLIVGAGGAARAIAAELVGEPIDFIHVTNRSQDKAEEVVKIVKSITQTAKFDSIAQSEIEYTDYDIVINATSLGLNVSDPLPLNTSLLNPHCVVCDIIMKPEETPLLSSAKHAGLKIHYGKHMLDYQLSFIAKFIKAFES